MQNIEQLQNELQNIDYAVLQKQDYDTYSKAHSEHAIKLRELRGLLKEHKASNSNIDFFFNYFENLLKGTYNYEWEYYDLTSLLNDYIVNCIIYNHDKIKAIEYFSEKYINFTKDLEKNVFAFVCLTNIFFNELVVFPSTFKDSLEVRTIEEIKALETLMVPIINHFISCLNKDLHDKIKEALSDQILPLSNFIDDIYSYDCSKLFGNYEEYTSFEVQSPKSDMLNKLAYFEILNNKISYVMIMNREIQSNYSTAITHIEFPESNSLNDLFESGKKRFGQSQGEGLVLLLSAHLIRTKFSSKDSLETLVHFTQIAEVLGTNVSRYISDDDDLLFLAKAINEKSHLIEYSKTDYGSFFKSLCFLAHDKESKDKGQVEIKRILVRWGMLDKKYIPKKYRIEAPERLPQTIEEFESFYKQLKVRPAFKLKAKAKKIHIPEDFPQEIRDVYLWKNGSDKREFPVFKELPKLKKDLESTFNYQKEDEDEIEGLEFTFPEVDIRNHFSKDCIAFGSEYSGDTYFIDPNTKASFGDGVVIRFYHDNILTGKVVASSMIEFLGRLCVEECINLFGPDKQLVEMLDSPVELIN